MQKWEFNTKKNKRNIGSSMARASQNLQGHGCNTLALNSVTIIIYYICTDTIFVPFENALMHSWQNFLQQIHPIYLFPLAGIQNVTIRNTNVC